MAASTALSVSVICTVFNEHASIERLLTSLAMQTRSPNEVVICDGGSDDGTVAVIENYARQHSDPASPQHLPNLRVIVEPGANISRGRNVAIAAAHGPIIAVTDAGVRIDPRWLEELVKLFEELSIVNCQLPDHRADQRVSAEYPAEVDDPAMTIDNSQLSIPLAVAGFFLPDVEGVFLTAMAATVLPLRHEIDPATFLPSSRSVAFTKAAWQQIGGYPEWLDYCEDLIFDLRMNKLRIANCESLTDTAHTLDKNQKSKIKNLKSNFVFAPNALVYFRPRTSLGSFWTQYYRYARGDGKADLWRKRHLIRYATYFVALPALLGHLFFGFFARWLGWAGLLAGVLIYCLRPWQRLAILGQTMTMTQKIQAALLVPIIRVVGDLAKMVGYPVGLWWRWRNRSRPEIWWRKDNNL